MKEKVVANAVNDKPIIELHFDTQLNGEEDQAK